MTEIEFLRTRVKGLETKVSRLQAKVSRLQAENTQFKALHPDPATHHPVARLRDPWTQKKVRSNGERVAVGLTYNPKEGKL